MKLLFNILFISLFTSVSISAQTSVSGSVLDKEGEALAGSTILFLHSDTIAGGSVTDSKGKFELKGLPAGEYECRVTMIGFKPESQKFNLTGKVKLPQFVLEEDATALDEVTVSAGMRSKELAGMSIYYLSDRAKNQNNAYDALKEIPRLIINPINRSIQLEDRRSPLILVNGVKKPLEAIDPKIIESVEIIDNPSARYRGDVNVTAVLNIKINKEKVQPYMRGEFGIISMLNNNFMWDEATLEAGTRSSSFYANGIYDQRKKSISDKYSEIRQANINRIESGQENGYWSNPSVKIGGDKEFSKKNYLAYRFNYVSSTSINRNNSNGSMEDTNKEELSPLSSIYYGNTKFKEISGNIYYKFTFNDQRSLDFDGKYEYTKNSSIGRRSFESLIYSYNSDINLYNSKHSGRLNINYSDMFTKSIHFEAGSNTEYSMTNIDDKVDDFPVFRYKRTHEYLYAGIDNNRSKSRFNYVVSLGLDMVFTDAEGTRHNYVDFVPSISLAYKISSKQNLKLSYNRSRTLPPTTNLNPYNTSTDSLKIMIGNPYLGPSHDNAFRLEYTLNSGKIRLNPYIRYDYFTDLIQPYGYMDQNIYISTYQNFGHNEEFETGVNFSLNMPCGNVGVSPYYVKNYLKGMPYSGENIGVAFYGYVYYKKLSMDWFFNFVPEKTYSLYSKTVSGPLNSRIHIVWKPVQAWSFVFQIQNFLFPRAHTKTWTINGNYLAYSSSVQRTLSPMISIGIWYNFVTRNFKWRNKKSFNDGTRDLEELKAN